MLPLDTEAVVCWQSNRWVWVWGCFSGVGADPLLSVKGKVHASACPNILDNAVIPNLWEHWKAFFYSSMTVPQCTKQSCDNCKGGVEVCVFRMWCKVPLGVMVSCSNTFAYRECVCMCLCICSTEPGWAWRRCTWHWRQQGSVPRRPNWSPTAGRGQLSSGEQRSEVTDSTYVWFKLFVQSSEHLYCSLEK